MSNIQLEVITEEVEVQIEPQKVIKTSLSHEQGPQGPRGQKGDNGESAYELAKRLGKPNTETEERWLQSLKGQKGEPGNDGAKGKDGQAGPPGASGEKGPQGEPGNDGAKGEDGQDGFSPTISIQESGKSHTITITDKDGPKAFTVLDGKDGNMGDINLEEYVTQEDMNIELQKKVDREPGKVLSSEDFTRDRKEKLDSYKDVTTLEIDEILKDIPGSENTLENYITKEEVKQQYASKEEVKQQYASKEEVKQQYVSKESLGIEIKFWKGSKEKYEGIDKNENTCYFII